MADNSLQAESASENLNIANTGLEQIKGWKNALGHTPFYCSSLDDGYIPMMQAQGMIEILEALFSAGRDGPADNDFTNISNATVSAALGGVSNLLNLAQLEADCFEQRSSLQKGGRA